MMLTMPKGFRIFTEGGGGRGRKPTAPSFTIGTDGTIRPSISTMHWFDGVDYVELGWNPRNRRIALLPVPEHARRPNHVPIRRYDRVRNVISGKSFLQVNQIGHSQTCRYRAERDASGIVYIDMRRPYGS